MNKPIELTIQETKEKLVNVLNECGLPHYVLTQITSELNAIAQQASVNATQQALQQYKEETEKEQKQNEITEVK